MDEKQWRLVGSVRRPADRNDNLLLYRRAASLPGLGPTTHSIRSSSRSGSRQVSMALSESAAMSR